ncbi:MAG: hypothetical protein QMC78_00275 [Methanocellales archaeon]|nr:hypothetical protein [Methanocellales archaeon]
MKKTTNKMSDNDLAFLAAKCYFGINEESAKDYDINIIDDIKRKLPPGGFIEEMEAELPKWWSDNIGYKSGVARMSMVDFMHHVNELRARRGSSKLPEYSELFNVWMEYIVSKYPDVYLVEVRDKNTGAKKQLLVNTGVVQRQG